MKRAISTRCSDETRARLEANERVGVALLERVGRLGQLRGREHVGKLSAASCSTWWKKLEPVKPRGSATPWVGS